MKHLRGRYKILPAGREDPRCGLSMTWYSTKLNPRRLSCPPSSTTLGHMPINALVDGPQLVLVGHKGILATLGKKKLLGGERKLDWIDLQKVRSFSVADLQDDTHGGGKFGRSCLVPE